MQPVQPGDTGRATVNGARELWTIPDFCQAFGRSKTFAYDALAAGTLRGVKSGRNTLLTNESVQAWRDSLPAFASGAAPKGEARAA